MADNRQFTDHNEIGGVNVYLEDKKLAESPEKNTVASTDYVLLKNTDGVPQKISKANLMGVVKDALGDLLRGNDLGTSVTNVPALGTNTFGSATVANLASVLGVVKRPSEVLPDTNLNNIREFGFYNIEGNETNCPFVGDPSNRGFMFCSGKTNANKFVQVIVNANSIFIRENPDGTWRDWYKMVGTLVNQ